MSEASLEALGAKTLDDAGSALKAALVSVVGAQHVHADEARRELVSHDIWGHGDHLAALVVAPGSLDEISSVVAAVQNAGWVIAPRGAGMSYTSGYVLAEANSVSLDMTRMARIVAINAADMTVTVEPGCSWSALHEALKPLGLRTPFWGPMSGLVSTVGGGLSQLNAMLGAGHYGTSSESVVALTVVLGDGSVLRTGARGAGGTNPFYRHYGPDLTGLFCGDCGVFGVKAEITLRLMRAPAHEAYASFSFKTGRGMLEAMAEIARAGVASETCAFDPGLTRVRMQRASLGSDLKTLGAVVAKQKSLMKGLVEASRIALGGRDFIGADDYPLHVIAEGRNAAAAQHDIGEARRIALAGGGTEIENTIAKVIRAQPFPPLNSVLGPGGERWAPVHGLAPLSQAATVFEDVEAVFAEMNGEFDRVGVRTGYLFTHMSTNAVIVEPVFYWPGASHSIHAAAMEPSHRAKLPVLADNPEATAVVTTARTRVKEIFERHGCGHFQIGRTYPYRASRDTASWALIEAVKQAVDPQRMLNPGVLGLDAQSRRTGAVKLR